MIRNDGEKSVVLSSGKAHRGIDNCTNLYRSMKIFLECPKFLDIHEKLSLTFFLSRIRIPKMPKKFKHQDFSECLIVLGRNEKDQQL